MRTTNYSFMKLLSRLMFLVLLITSCEDVLKENKFDFISPADIQDSDEGADLWVTGVYNKLSNNIFQYGTWPLLLDIDCDYSTGPEWAYGTFGAGNYQATTSTATFWEGLYSVIHRASYAEENIKTMSNLSDKHRDNVLGELSFLKAFSYFYLVRAFGELPIRKTSINEALEEAEQPRRSIEEVYEYIISLLLDAEKMMYKNTESGFVEGHASAGAAASLLAKVYATIGSAAMPEGNQIIVRGGKPFMVSGSAKIYTNPVDRSFSKHQVKGYENFDHKAYYKLAMDKAAQIINGEFGSYDLLPFDDLWKQSNKNKIEHIWSHQALSGDDVFGVTYSRAYSGVYNSSKQISDGLWYGMRDHWYKLFDNDDYRITKGVMHRWVRIADVNYNTGSYYPNNEVWRKKAQGYTDNDGNLIPPVAPFNDGITYKSNNNANYLAYLIKFGDVSDNTIVRQDPNFPFLRFADVLLIYAEAANEYNENPTIEALNALNRVRSRSNAIAKTIDPSVAGNINDIVLFRSTVIEERAMEFACEGDRRWDLIRWGIYLQAMNDIGGVDEVNVSKSRQEKHLLLPLPVSEINTNKAIIENNPGW